METIREELTQYEADKIESIKARITELNKYGLSVLDYTQDKSIFQFPLLSYLSELSSLLYYPNKIMI